MLLNRLSNNYREGGRHRRRHIWYVATSIDDRWSHLRSVSSCHDRPESVDAAPHATGPVPLPTGDRRA